MRAMTMLIVLAGTACILAPGCGKEPAAQADTQPFEQAITRYLAQKNMGMKVAEFRSLEVQGDLAQAVCRMAEASGMHNVKVTWSFEFERNAEGGWEVVGHKRE